MKVFPLSGFTQKTTCLIIIILFAIINIIISYLNISPYIKVSALILSVLISLFYVFVIFLSKITIDTNARIITIHMFNKTIINLNTVEKINIMENKVQNKNIFIIVFFNFNGEIVGKINTFFTTKQKQLAQEIVDFTLNLIHK